MSHSKKYELDELEGVLRVVKVLQSKGEADKYYIEVKRKERSYEQLKLYWGKWLPAILYYLKAEIMLNTEEELHIYMKEWYCLKTNKTDAFKRVIINGKIRYICMFSIALDKASPIEVNDYLRFIEENFFELIDEAGVVNIDDLIARYNEI